MKKMMVIFAILSGIVALFGCTPDPRKAAEARAIDLEAQAAATSTAQALAQDQADYELEKEIREARKVEVIETWRMFVKVVGLGAIAATFYVVFYIGRAGATVATGLANATVAAAELKALQVHLDEETRTYPLLMRPIHNGRFLLHDPNSGSSTVLDMNNPVDRQLIAVSGAVRLAGTVAREARQHESDPAGVSVVANVPVIGAEYAAVSGQGPAVSGERSLVAKAASPKISSPATVSGKEPLSAQELGRLGEKRVVDVEVEG